ncbi:bcl-2-like protein 13 [Cebidichthys violaceus]|uniref:bcl-2-like protein 13 n=1 Tax=Cebidichthys violaceus TaxID=271503 RepID=UPI0035CAB6D3
MGDVDPDDTKSLDSNDGGVLGGEENHSFNSDMVHLEREEAEMLEEAEKARRTEEEEEDDEDLQTSVLSLLGGERELVELSEEEQDLHAPETEELLVSAEEPRVEKKKPAEFMQVVPPMALPLLPIVRLDPPSTTSTPVPSTTSSEAEELYPTQGLQPPSFLAQVEAEPLSERQLKFSQIPLSDVEEHSVQSSQAAPEKPEPPQPTAPKTPKPLSSTELLCGGAVLVAVVGVVAYGAVAYCRK